MNCISDTEKFARRMFRICLVLAVGMALITLYWWILWDRIWLSPVDSIEEALYGRNVTGILAQLWLLRVFHPQSWSAKPVLTASCGSPLRWYPGPGSG